MAGDPGVARLVGSLDQPADVTVRCVHRRLPGARRRRLLRDAVVNDTHLANDPGRDPDFDHGFPRSPFQEIVTWRVPNSRTFGGHGKHGEHGEGQCGDKGHGYAKPDKHVNTHPAKKAKVSSTAVRKARTPLGRRVGTGYRRYGP